MRAVSHKAESGVSTPEAFQARMEAQCNEIQQYMVRVKQKECRELTLEQAAKEWIKSSAGDFARENG
jgi:hypothetical protein